MFGRGKKGGRGGKLAPVKDFEHIKFRDQAQRDNFELLTKTDMVPTRFLSVATMANFGMDDALRILFHATGLGAFYGMLEFTHRDLTLEFLSAFTYDHVAEKVSFCFGGRDYNYTTNEFAAFFGIPPANGLELDFYAEEVWICLTGTNEANFDISKMRISAIQDPRFKIWFRTLAGTLFGRGNADKANTNEVCLLGCYLNVNGGEDLIVYDVPGYFAAHLARLASGKGMKHICIGGLVTYLAKKLFNFEGNGYSAPMTSLVPVIDAEYLANSSHWIDEFATRKYKWIVNRNHTLRIPLNYLPLIERRAPKGIEQSSQERPSYLVPMGIDRAGAGGSSSVQHIGGSAIPPPAAESSSSSQFTQAYVDGFNRNNFYEQRHCYERVTQNLMHYHQYNSYYDQGIRPTEVAPAPAFWTGRDNYPGTVFSEYGVDPSRYNSTYHETFGGAGGQFLPPVEDDAPRGRRGGRRGGRGGRVRRRTNDEDEEMDG